MLNITWALASVAKFKFRALVLWHEQQSTRQKVKICHNQVFVRGFVEHVEASLILRVTKVSLLQFVDGPIKDALMPTTYIKVGVLITNQTSITNNSKFLKVSRF